MVSWLQIVVLTQDNFVSGSELIKNGEYLFNKNGIYANEKYHELIAERILEKILPTIDKIAAPNSTLPKVEPRKKIPTFTHVISYFE